MKVTMVIPSYWGRARNEGWKTNDAVYDHPSPLDETGTLPRLLKSLSTLKKRDFNLVIIGVSTAADIQEEVETKVSSIIKEETPDVDSFLFSYSHLDKIHQILLRNGLKDFIPLLQLKGYSNIRNLCVFLPHVLDSDIAVLIDDDEIFENPLFMDKALEFIGQKKVGERILAVAGYYINPDDDYLINKEIPSWMSRWNTIGSMNRSFKEIIGTNPRLKETPFAFGGNMVLHRDLFSKVPFDPNVPRGEDIDFLINARMFGFKVFLDNQLSIKHIAPPKAHPLWKQVREDIFRFVYEKRKLETQESKPNMLKVSAEDLDPYPGEFLKEDQLERISHANQMLSSDYLRKEDKEGAKECMKNINLAENEALSIKNPFQELIELQKNWRNLMSVFSSEQIRREACDCFFPL